MFIYIVNSNPVLWIANTMRIPNPDPINLKNNNPDPDLKAPKIITRIRNTAYSTLVYTYGSRT